ncbi:hypothetical protein Pelo_12539 [Pelomyxa schiedti]|nr:hypothetical protein Pelo_12539 [Pelomyxa schiedti]
MHSGSCGCEYIVTAENTTSSSTGTGSGSGNGDESSCCLGSDQGESETEGVFGDVIRVRIEEGITPYTALVASITSGAKKHGLTQWWLNLIESKVEEWLEHRGYDTSALPYNYIDQRPKSLEALSRDLEIIHQLLSDTPTSSELKRDLVASLRKVIYKRIDDYVELLESFLRYLLQSRKSINELSPEQLQTLLNSLPHEDSEIAIESMRDLEYIREMKRLEKLVFGDPVPSHNDTLLYEKLSASTVCCTGSAESSAACHSTSKGGTSDPGLAHIVPVTGLIFNHLSRMENELKTALSHWSGRS